jgi:hypothetical protein
MDPFVTTQIIQAAGLVAKKMDEFSERLDVVTSKQDQLISREIKAAYSALQDYLISSNPQTKERRLAFAEDALLKNTKLNLELDTEDKGESLALSGAELEGFWRCAADEWKWPICDCCRFSYSSSGRNDQCAPYN